MKNKLIKAVMATTTALTMVACGSGGSGLAGVGGSGYVSSGSITGFGSVFVNGVEFETDTATTFNVDGVSGTQDDLAIGMIVKVDGNINADGISGTATSISFDDQLQGPVASLGLVVEGKRSFTVLGTTVIIDSGTTIFDVSDSLPIDTVFGFDTILDSNNVEISGFYNSTGVLLATRVELEDATFTAGSSIVEVKGIIKNLTDTTFELGTLTIDASTANLDDLPGGLVNDQLVEVKGTFDVANNTISATRVEAEDESIADTHKFELEGLISNYVDNTNFNIGGVNINASNAVFKPATLVLANDLHIEAEGAIVNGVLVATEIELDDTYIKAYAIVSAINPTNNSFEVAPVSGQPAITITVTTDTQLEDNVTELVPFTLGDFREGDFVESQLFDDAGTLTAKEVHVKLPADVILQDFASAATGNATAGGTITLLGVDYGFTATTKFKNKNNVVMLEAEINSLLTEINTVPQSQLIKIQDNDPADGVADEIDME